MTYRLKCSSCRNTFESNRRSADCPRWTCSGSSSSRTSDIIDLALDVALVYSGANAALDIADAGLSVVGSLFDW